MNSERLKRFAKSYIKRLLVLSLVVVVCAAFVVGIIAIGIHFGNAAYLTACGILFAGLIGVFVWAKES